LKKALQQYDILVISLASPFLVGLYEDNILIKEWSSDEKISEALLTIITSISNNFNISRTIYTRGPGSHMATKLTYLMLKTIEISMNIECFGCSGFEFSKDKPIKAIGNLYFVKEKETIITKKFDEPIDSGFVLPINLNSIELDLSSEPLHLLPSV
jgi:tRNA A37 threonylcarbamoyladenosine modification protein TsaB